MKRFCLIILTLMLAGPCSFAQDTSKQQELKKKIEAEISFIDKQLRNLNTKQKASRESLALIQKKAANRKALIANLDSQIDATRRQINEKDREIRQLQAEIDTLSAYYSRLIYNAYKNRNTKVWFMYVLASEDIGQGYRRLTYLKNLSATLNTQAQKIRTKREELEVEKSRMEAYLAQSNAMKADREREYNSLLAEEKESQAIISSIAKNQSKYKKELAKKRKEVERLNSEIQRIISSAVAAENKKKKETAKGKNLPVDDKLSGSFAQNRGRLGWPVSRGVVTEKFGVNMHPVYKNIRLPECNGITINTDRNAEVRCVFEGTVKQIVMMPGYGQCVLVQHGEYFTFYCKLRKVTVKAGQKIPTGQVLGYLEADGKSSSIHFQIWKGTQKQNPESWLRPQ